MVSAAAAVSFCPTNVHFQHQNRRRRCRRENVIFADRDKTVIVEKLFLPFLAHSKKFPSFVLSKY